jgi:hypothetical protein
MIDKEDAAGRLARAIASDIRLYNGAKLGVGTKAEAQAAIAAEISEGRALYESRVSPSLRPLFDAALEEVIFSRLGQAPPSSGSGADVPPSSGLLLPVLAALVALVGLLLWIQLG